MRIALNSSIGIYVFLQFRIINALWVVDTPVMLGQTDQFSTFLSKELRCPRANVPKTLHDECLPFHPLRYLQILGDYWMIQ